MLPSSLTEGRSFTSGGFPRPTGVGVRYGQRPISLAAFLGGLGRSDFRPLARTRASGHVARVAGLPTTHTPGWQPILSIRWVHFPYRVPASLCHDRLWCRTVRPACHRLRLQRPRLRSRLTLGRLTLPRNPQACGVRGSHTDDATHSGILSSLRSTSPRGLASRPRERSPTMAPLASPPSLLPRSCEQVWSSGGEGVTIHSFGTMLEPRYVVGARALDQ